MSRLRLAVLTALSLALLLTGVTGHAEPADATPRAEPATAVQLRLQSVDPGIARPGRAIVLTGTVQNTGDHSVPSPVVRVRVSARGLDTRSRVAAWADGTDTGSTGGVVGEASIPGPLLPDQRLPFTVRVGPKVLHPGLSFGNLPTTLEVLPGVSITQPAGEQGSPPRTTVVARPGAAPLGSLRTFLPWDDSTGYHRLRMSWVVPLTLPPDPALFGAPGRDRTAAWAAAIGPGSPIDGVLTGTADAPVTYLLDPVMVSPFVQPAPTPGGSTPSGRTEPSGPSGPSGTPTGGPTTGSSSTPSSPGSSGPSSSSTGSAPSGSASRTGPPPSGSSSPSGPGTTTPPDPERQVAALADDVAARLGNQHGTGTSTAHQAGTAHQVWALPADDPDLGSILRRTGQVTDLPTLAGLMQTKIPPGLGEQVRGGVAWPVGTRLDRAMVGKLRRAYATAPHPLVAALTPRSAVRDLDQPTRTAAHKSPGGLPLLAYDERLSALAAATSEEANGGATVQRFLAETMAIYQQQPAVDRSVLVAPPRGFAGDPEVLQELFTQLRRTPWIEQVPAESLLRAARHAEPMTAPVAAPDRSPGSRRASPGYPRPGATPLTTARLRQLQHVMHELDGIAAITAGGQVDLVGRPAASDRQLLSTRWRGAPVAWTTLAEQVRGATRTLRESVHVVPSNVNFLAEEGALQITVVNNLDADVRGVDLELITDSPNLRIARQPGLLHIGAHSRTSVRVHVSAIGSGDVPIHTLLTTPNGTRLGTEPSVVVHVQPTGSWIYGVVGIVAALILALGLFRTYRRSRGRQREQSQREPSQRDDENGTHPT